MLPQYGVGIFTILDNLNVPSLNFFKDELNRFLSVYRKRNKPN